MTSEASTPADQALLDQAYDLACDILEESRASLMMALRFMDVALWRLSFDRRTLDTPLSTDGYRLYLSPLRVVDRFRADRNEVVRDYLHAVLHCVFRHPFDGNHPNVPLWDLACDIAVEACALELVGVRFPSALDAERTRALEKLRGSCPTLTASKVYRLLVPFDFDDGDPAEPLPEAFVETLPALFCRDDHSVWTRTEERPRPPARVDDKSTIVASEGDQRLKGNDDGPKDEDEDDRVEPAVDAPGSPAPSTGGMVVEGEVENGDAFLLVDTAEVASGVLAGMDGVVPADDFDELSWKDISAIIDMEMEAFTGRFGVDAGTFEVNLSVANRKVYDYRDFLRKFASRTEEMKVSTEEFDYIFYTYGLRTYGNMPLVEPLEYQESNRVREFVIAIDTSASCAGGLVKTFIQKTYDVLKSTQGFGRKINVHVIQCDCDIRKDSKITEAGSVDDEFFEFTARGFGGTDFRPVFAYVDELVAMRELPNLKGLIYLTDGIGKYPAKPPEYDCAFVFVDESQTDRMVPPWAMKVFMSEDEIVEL